MVVKIKKMILFLSVFTLLGMIFLTPISLVSANNSSSKLKDNELSNIWTKTPMLFPSCGFGIDLTGNKLYAVGSVLNPAVMKFEALLVAYNTKGTLLWSSTLGGENNYIALGVATQGNNIYIVGNTFNDNLKVPDKALFAKYSSDGNLKWSITWNEGFYAAATAVASVDNAVYVAGYSYNPKQEATDIFLIKFSTNGEALWTKTWGGKYNDAPTGIAVEDNKIYIVGGTMGKDGEVYAFILKFNDRGELKLKTVWGAGIYDAASAVVVAGDKIFVSGVTMTPDGDLDAVLSAFNKKFELKWDTTWGGDGNDAATDLAVGSEGNIFVVGDTTPLGEKYNAFLLKYDREGKLKATAYWGGLEEDLANGVEAAKGCAYVVGVSNYNTMTPSMDLKCFQDMKK